MATTKQVWGIDLGQCAPKALCLRAAGDKVEVVNHVYIEHERILSQPDVDRAALIETAVKQFTEKHDLTKERIVVGVPGQHTLARFSKLPPVDKKKIPEIVKYEAQQQIPFDMEEVIWDYQVFGDGDAAETEVGIFAMRRELLRDHLLFLSSRTLEPAVVQATPLALYNALRYEGVCGGDEAVVIVDIGAQNTDLIVADGDSLWTRNIPIGGNNFTEALLKTFKLSFRKAENLKRNAGSHKYARQIFQAMRPVFADLVAEIQRSIGFFTSSRRGVKFDKLIAMGSAFKLPGLVKFVQQNLGMEVTRATTFQKLSASDAPDAPELMDQLLSFGAAYGLALQGLGSAQITSSLLPPEIAKQVVWRKKTPWFYGAAASLALSAGLIWGRNSMDKAAVASQGGNERTFTFTSVPDPDDPEKVIDADSEAYAGINDGPPATTPIGRAKWMIAAAGHINGLVSDFDGQRQTERAKIEEVESLTTNKTVWAEVLHLIHSALPQPDPELAQAIAAGPEAYKKLIASERAKYARGNRRVIFINDFVADYHADVLSAYKAATMQGGPSTAGGGGGHSAAPAPMAGDLKPGFLVMLTGRTPAKEANNFIDENFFDRLLAESEKYPGMYIHKPEFNYCRTIGDQGGEFGGGFVGGPENVDSVTGESILEDSEFEVVFAVVLGEEPQDPEEGGSESSF